MVTAARILTLGETMGVAVTPSGESLESATAARLDVAGAESTVAIGLARLGVAAGWLGVVGHDALGDRILRELRAEGVETGSARRVDAPTGFMLRERRSPGITAVTYYRTESAGSQIAPSDVDAAFAEFRPTLLHLTGITPALSESAAAAVRRAAELARTGGVEVSLDVNLRRTLPGYGRSLEVVRELLPVADLVFIGDDEVHAVCAATEPLEVTRDLLRRGVGEVVIKRGTEGAQATLDGQTFSAAAVPVVPVDAVGAGDSFAAGYLAARSFGMPGAERLRWATVAAAFTVGGPSDWQSLPTRAELEAFDASAPTRR